MEHRDRITVRGFDLTKDLLGKIDLGAMAWLEITRTPADAREAEVFNRAARHAGRARHDAAGDLDAADQHLLRRRPCRPRSPPACSASAACSPAAPEQIARMLQAALDGKPADADLAAIASDIVEDYVARKAPVPGIGHPLHKPIDPRTPVLFAIAEKNGYRGRYVALLEAICAQPGKAPRPQPADQRHRRDRRDPLRARLPVAHLPRRRDHRPRRWGWSATSPRRCETRSATKSTSASSTR